MGWTYRNLIRPALFARESEAIHNQTLAILGGLVVASLTLLTWGRLQRWRAKRAIND